MSGGDDPAPLVELGPDGVSLFEQWSESCDAVESWTNRRDELAGMLLSRLPKRARAAINGRVVFSVVPARDGERFDQRAFREAEPDEYNRWLVPIHFAAHLRRPPQQPK